MLNTTGGSRLNFIVGLLCSLRNRLIIRRASSYTLYVYLAELRHGFYLYPCVIG